MRYARGPGVRELREKIREGFSMLDPQQAGSHLTIYLAEYNALKSEQAHRIGFRDNLVYAALVATAAVAAFAFKKDGSPVALLALPAANFVLGWLYTNNDAKSCAIGQYLRYVLGKRIYEVTGPEYPELRGTDACVFGWESEVRTIRFRRWRKRTELVSVVITFIVPGVLALGAYWLWFRGDYRLSMSIVLWIISILEAGLLAVLGVWIRKAADTCPEMGLLG
jgi:hypothetical protein